MTIPQAITLVTLRLGALETKMMNLEMQLPSILAGDNTTSIDFSENGVIQSLMERVDNIEKHLVKGDVNQNTNPTELTAIKNQLDTIKQSLIQFKGISATLVNDNKSLRVQLEKIKLELVESNQLLNTLQTTSNENAQKILQFELSIVPTNGVSLEDLETEYEEEDGEDNSEIQATFSLTNTNANDSSELIFTSQQDLLGINLKEAIEMELNNV
jgi:hypothetical protein